MTKTNHPTTINQLLSDIAKHGSKQALATYGSNDGLTYSQLVAKVVKVTSSLKNSNKLQVGDRVMLYGLVGSDWVVTFMACLYGGYIAVPVDVRMNSELVTDLIEHTKPSLIIHKSKLDIKTKSKHIIFTELLKKEASPNKLDSFEPLDGDTIAEIILTSGTWSQPKGVTLTHKNLLSNLAGVDAVYRLNGNEKLLSILPLSHAYEQMCGLFIPLYRGATITYMSEIRADILVEAIKEHRITTIVAVPRILELLRKGVLGRIADSKRLAFESFVIRARLLPLSVRRRVFAKVHQAFGTSLKTFVIGGAPLAQKLDYFFQGLGYSVLVGYGLSETSPVLSISLGQKRSQSGVGRPLSSLKVILNDEGEVLVQGDSVFYGYWPERHDAEYFNTGDLGRIDRKGNLTLVGRSKNLVIFPSGDKVFLEDIEKITDGLPGVDESCAVNLGDDKQPHLHLFVVTSVKEVDPFLKRVNAKLPFGVRVKSVSLASGETLPRTHTLKLSRKQIINHHSEQIAQIKVRPS